MIQLYISELDNMDHFDNERHCCNKDCELLKNKIAVCVRELVMPSQSRFLYEVTVYIHTYIHAYVHTCIHIHTVCVSVLLTIKYL